VNLICECNVCGYIGDDRNSHDCSAHMQQRIATLTAQLERVREIAKLLINHSLAINDGVVGDCADELLREVGES